MSGPVLGAGVAESAMGTDLVKVTPHGEDKTCEKSGEGSGSPRRTEKL